MRISHFIEHLSILNSPKVFRTNQRLRRHSSIHRNDKFTCTICGMESTSLDGLQKHMSKLFELKVKIDNQKLFWKLNSIEFLIDLLLVYIHKPKTESFECDICSKTFNNKSYLSQHKAKHKITGRGTWHFYWNEYDFRLLIVLV